VTVVGQTDPVVTVTTVLFNSASALPAYARALGPSVAHGLVRVVGVDNASPDHSAALFKELLPGAEMIRSPVNVGFAGGCNLAWPQVHTPYWMLLNPDVQLHEEDVTSLVRWMDSHPRIGVASPMLLGDHGEEVPVARPHDSLWRPLMEALRLHKLVPEPARSRLLLAGRRATPEIIDGWVPGAAMIARSEAVATAGLLDERLFMYGEDRQWCWQMRQAGWEVGVCNEVKVAHQGGTSATATWERRDHVRREVAGHLRTTRSVRGAAYTRLLALVLGVTMMSDALDPRSRSTTRSDRRLRAREYLRATWKLPEAPGH
jgi:N-acetylglucosaminyl-diphospho-decaprenol L-rhamnosyltransferase